MFNIHTPRFVQKLNGSTIGGGGGGGGAPPFNLQVQSDGVTVGSGLNIINFETGSVSVAGTKATYTPPTGGGSLTTTKAVYIPATSNNQTVFMLPENATTVFYAGPLGIGARWTFTGPKTLTLDMAQLGFGLVVGEAILVVYAPA